MSELLATLDPGLRACGIAVFRDSTLVAAGLPRNPQQRGRGGQTWFAMSLSVRLWLHERGFVTLRRVIAECPQVYTAGKAKGDPNDLIELAGVVGAVLGQADCDDIATVSPREWKGTLDADVMTERIRERLTATEAERIDPDVPEHLQHNTLDAIGIGLHVLGRLAPRKVYPR